MDVDKTTILIPRKLRLAAARRAREMGISLGELIRRKLQEELPAEVGSARARDPLFAGMEDLGPWQGEVPPDLAVKHDEYLYGD